MQDSLRASSAILSRPDLCRSPYRTGSMQVSHQCSTPKRAKDDDQIAVELELALMHTSPSPPSVGRGSSHPIRRSINAPVPIITASPPSSTSDSSRGGSSGTLSDNASETSRSGIAGRFRGVSAGRYSIRALCHSAGRMQQGDEKVTHSSHCRAMLKR